MEGDPNPSQYLVTYKAVMQAAEEWAREHDRIQACRAFLSQDLDELNLPHTAQEIHQMRALLEHREQTWTQAYREVFAAH